MKYMLAKNAVIYITPKKHNFRLNCITGKVWVTKSSEIKDFILFEGDGVSMEKSRKNAVQAFEDTCLNLEGERFDLIELKKIGNSFKCNTLKISRTNNT